jgi:pimeloyl-ACP methyl ester carboxylesterase
MMAEDAVALLAHLGIERAHVIGKSMGGMVAQLIAAKYPERVRSLVLASTLMKHDSHGENLLALARKTAEKQGLFATYEQAFLMSYSPKYCETNRSRLQEVQAMMQQMDENELVQGYVGQSVACQHHDSRTLAGKIKAPALVIVGNDDSITTPQQSRDLSEAIPRSELVILPRGGHGAWREFPEDSNEVVRSFLERN